MSDFLSPEEPSGFSARLYELLSLAVKRPPTSFSLSTQPQRPPLLASIFGLFNPYPSVLRSNMDYYDSDVSISRPSSRSSSRPSSPPSSCKTRSGSDGSDTAPSSVSNYSSDRPRIVPVQPVQGSRVSRWEIVVPYDRVWGTDTDISVSFTENRFDGDQTRDPSVPARFHESAIHSLVDYLDNEVPTGNEPRDGNTLRRVREYIRNSDILVGGLLVGQAASLRVGDDQTAFRLTVDVDTAI